MKRTRTKYDREFKIKAVELSNHRGNVSEIAIELGINPELLYRWRKEFANYASNSFPGRGIAKMTDQERENVELRRKLKDITMERDILKKAVGIFSVSDGKSTNL